MRRTREPPTQTGPVIFYSTVGGVTNRDTPRGGATTIRRTAGPSLKTGKNLCNRSEPHDLFSCLSIRGTTSNNTLVIAGRIRHFLPKWKQLTQDSSILKAVMGYRIEFFVPPVQFDIPRPIKFSMQETANVDAQITKFLEKGIIVESSHEDGEFISNIFL